MQFAVESCLFCAYNKIVNISGYSMDTARRAAFVINPAKPESTSVGDMVIQAASAQGYFCERCRLEDLSVHLSGTYDLMVVVGGDGTIHKAAAEAAQMGIPILGVNLGRVGFLSEVLPDQFSEALARFTRGEVIIDERLMLRCRVNDQSIVHRCINDILLYKRSFSGGVACIRMEIDGLFVGDVNCDGLIASTPTGATGYSISAGGPIIAPGLNAAIVTPVCPHALHMRPIVAPPEAELTFTMLSDGGLYVDGRHTAELNKGDRITVTRAETKARFVRIAEQNLYALIHKKLT